MLPWILFWIAVAAVAVLTFFWRNDRADALWYRDKFEGSEEEGISLVQALIGAKEEIKYLEENRRYAERDAAKWQDHCYELEEKLAGYGEKKAKEIKLAREDAVKKSKAVNRGQAFEQFAPFLMDHNPKDFRHLGDPIDFLLLVGYDDLRAKRSKTLKEIILLDIKSGKSDLSTEQRRIRDAVVDGRVRFGLYNTDKQQLRLWPPTSND